MREIRTSGLMSGERKRSDAHRAQATAPLLDSTEVVNFQIYASPRDGVVGFATVSLTGRLAVVFEAGDGRWMAICRGSGMTVRCLSPRGRLSRGFGWSGYPGLSLATTRAKCALSGQALER